MSFADLRKKNYYTQQRLADTLGVKQATVAMWETKKSVPCMKNIIALSVLFKVSIETIYDALKS